ncbi:S8 family peptidase [Streptomyces halobius]|uniref:S8 family peptidase n=1 Tax=Streptomyces halobius TaxID=2879846 RepID=A0ABY4M2X1_9ACTN|nr:S8 family peptidase [Streptomyces halobius]UQA92119.1 S8 family peptidase [Streptomyces halobius]
MKKTPFRATSRRAHTVAVVAAATAALAAPLLFAGPSATAAEPHSVGTVHIVQIRGVAASADEVTKVATEMTAQNGGELRRIYYSASQSFSATLTDDQVAKYLNDSRVDSVTKDHTYQVAGEPGAAPSGFGGFGGFVRSDDGPSAPGWGLDRIDQRELPLDGGYSAPNTASDARVYIVDTGLRTTHEEFGGRAHTAYDAIAQTRGEDGDCHGHGTASAAIAAGERSGAAKEAGIESVRAFGCDGTGSMEHIMTAVDWITAHAERPAVVSLGFSGEPGTVVDRQLYNMTRLGIPYTAAAGGGSGGSGSDACMQSPGRQTTGITVAATDQRDSRPAWSNYGACVHLFAPGENIPTAGAASDDAYRSLSGTSAATAEATGAVAMYLSDHPDATPVDIDKALIEASTKDHVQDPGTGSKNRLLYVGDGSAAGDPR